MKRRALLCIAATGAAGLAGCGGLASERTPTPTTEPAPPLAEQGTPPTICDADVVDVGIYAIDEPAFAPDWSGVEVAEEYAMSGGLADDHVVVGVAGPGGARAYPLSVLWTHEIVNDGFPSGGDDDPVGGPLLVTYCSLCRSGMVARRQVDGEPATFAVSGQLWTAPELEARVAEAQNRSFAVERSNPDPGSLRNTGNLVMVDLATGSYWSQILARAICGSQAETVLEVVPSTTVRWADWRGDHPDTEVLLPPPRSGVLAPPY